MGSSKEDKRVSFTPDEWRELLTENCQCVIEAANTYANQSLKMGEIMFTMGRPVTYLETETKYGFSVGNDIFSFPIRISVEQGLSRDTVIVGHDLWHVRSYFEKQFPAPDFSKVVGLMPVPVRAALRIADGGDIRLMRRSIVSLRANGATQPKAANPEPILRLFTDSVQQYTIVASDIYGGFTERETITTRVARGYEVLHEIVGFYAKSHSEWAKCKSDADEFTNVHGYVSVGGFNGDSQESAKAIMRGDIFTGPVSASLVGRMRGEERFKISLNATTLEDAILLRQEIEALIVKWEKGETLADF